MIDRDALLDDLKALTSRLVDDLRERSEQVDEIGVRLRGEHSRAQAAGRTDRSFEEWREDQLTQAAVGWVLASVFVRFCEDNGLVDAPLLSGPGDGRRVALDTRAEWFAANRAAGYREWLEHVLAVYQPLPGAGTLFGDRNPLWIAGPTADGAQELLDLWLALDDDGDRPRHDFTDPDWDTRFLGDLYQDLSEHAKKNYALLQTPEFVESFILDRTLEPALAEFGVAGTRMIDPTCGSGHFLLGGFERILDRWRDAEPATPTRELVQRTLDAVCGVDLNPFAASIATFRLLVAALKASRIERLADAPMFRVSVAVADSLLHGKRPDHLHRLDVGDDAASRHHYASEDPELAARLLEGDQYQVVVGNPPYITPKDPGLNTAYRTRYESCHRQYSLGVPFTERFFDLAAWGEGGGYVGMITANSFMKREFGKKLIEEQLPKLDVTHVIDTSGAYIPGHGTPTVILLGRDQRPASDQVRSVLGIRGEPGRPADPAKGEVWTSITAHLDEPGFENDYVSVLDLDRASFAKHPWSLQGGAAPAALERIESKGRRKLEEVVSVIGFGGITGEDNVYMVGADATVARQRIEDARPLVIGEDLRDWLEPRSAAAIWPYDGDFGLRNPEALPHMLRLMWPYRKSLLRRKRFGTPIEELSRPWYEWRELYDARLRTPLSIVFAFVATHNHFVLDRGGKVFKQSAPVIKLPNGATEDEHLALLGLLNSSTACFWMKQVFHDKGVGGIGGGIGDEKWEPRYEFDGTKLKQFPVPTSRPTERAKRLDDLAQALSATLPDAVCADAPPTRERLDKARAEAEAIRQQMVAQQEELDWACYRLYGLTDDDITVPIDETPEIERGQRAFEILLARRVAAGETTTTWFERHGSDPTTEIPDHWPETYRDLVERRIALIESDRKLNLLERPEYKRRWNWADWDQLEQDAVRQWLLDRLEAREHWATPALRTTARLADLLRGDPDFAEAAAVYTGRRDTDLTDLVTDLVASDAVPYLAAYRYTATGLRKRRVWEQVWDLQRQEDAIDARVGLPDGHPDKLTQAQADKEKAQLRIPVPPKYATKDFTSTVAWRLRGKLDVPKERFISYPGTGIGADSTPVIGWAGWDHLEQATALAAHYTARQESGADSDELLPLLAGLHELAPWLEQWHDDPHPDCGYSLAQFYSDFVDEQAAVLGVAREQLADYEPPAKSRARRKRR